MNKQKPDEYGFTDALYNDMYHRILNDNQRAYYDELDTDDRKHTFLRLIWEEMLAASELYPHQLRIKRCQNDLAAFYREVGKEPITTQSAIA